MQYGCIGEKLSHSFSKEIHGALQTYQYELKELAANEVVPFLKERDFCAVNVTLPYKQTVIPYLDFVSDRARRIGAANTIVNREGKLYGYNTDFYGMELLLKKNGIVLTGKKVLILGSGGTSKTALAVATEGGAGEVYRVSRSKREGCITYDEAVLEHTDAQVIINTTPCGMYPNIKVAPIDLAPFTKLEAVADAVYNPICSMLVLQAKERGLVGVGGLYMLVMQAVKAIEFFVGKCPDKESAEKVYLSQLQSKQNIVLIGMASCGKSSVGRELAKTLGRKFVDTDDLIVASAGKSIPEIFAEKSESGFRELESQAISELSSKQGLVIATGGGAILREENVRALRQNGVLFFLDRPLDELVATNDRPLSSNKEDLEKRFYERYDKYMAAADKRIAVTQTDGIANTAQTLIKEWKNETSCTQRTQP